MKHGIAAALLAATVSAYPNAQNIERDTPGVEAISKLESNCGPRGPCLGFNEKAQRVSTSGDHAFMAPGKNDIRGPCPGLNAAANHGYLPRDGVPNILQSITGLSQAYSFGVALSGFLAAYAVVLNGDVITETWSIGGPPPFNDITGLLSPPQGISFSHNNYEGDSSIGRNDAYLNGGDAESLNVTRFGYAYQLGQEDGSDRYTLDKFRRDVVNNQKRSIENNPYYFTGLFSTTLVSPAAYNFVINMMSNHSADEPNGYFNGEMFKQFFAVEGDYDADAEGSGFGFTWNRGQERIPENWYKRPLLNAYENEDVVDDLAIGWAAYPDSFRFGGNVNGVNTYQGVDVATLTGGKFTPQDLLNSKNFGCLVYQTLQQGLPNELQGTINEITKAMDLLGKHSQFFKNLGCPSLEKFNDNAYGKFPGYKTRQTRAPKSQGGSGGLLGGGGILGTGLNVEVEA